MIDTLNRRDFLKLGGGAAAAGVLSPLAGHADETAKKHAIKKALPVSEELGDKIAIENVWNDFVTKPEQAVELMDAVGSPQVGWHFDIGNSLRYSPPETWIPVLGKRILKLHIKEYSQFQKF